MYIHLGQDTLVKKSDIIGIFDLDTASVSKRTRDFLRRAEKEGRVVNVSFELPKSFIVCQHKNEKKIYISQISSATLLKRSEADFENSLY
jgi:hypothetical protein